MLYLVSSTSVDSVLGYLKGLREQCRKGREAKFLLNLLQNVKVHKKFVEIGNGCSISRGFVFL